MSTLERLKTHIEHSFVPGAKFQIDVGIYLGLVDVILMSENRSVAYGRITARLQPEGDFRIQVHISGFEDDPDNAEDALRAAQDLVVYAKTLKHLPLVKGPVQPIPETPA